MIRLVFRTVLLLVLLVGAAAILSGWRIRDVVGTRGIDAEKAKQVGAEVGERAAAATEQARRALADGSVTAKIKAKIALDDTLKGASVKVDTNGTTVIVSGTVQSSAQRERVLQLARETAGVTKVEDKLSVD